MGMPGGWNKKGLHNLKRKRRQRGMGTWRKQKHPLNSVISPAISLLGLEAAKQAKKKK